MTAAPDLEGQWTEAEPGALPSWHTLGYFFYFFYTLWPATCLEF